MCVRFWGAQKDLGSVAEGGRWELSSLDVDDNRRSPVHIVDAWTASCVQRAIFYAGSGGLRVAALSLQGPCRAVRFAFFSVQ
jgi:hypothetical protein